MATRFEAVVVVAHHRRKEDPKAPPKGVKSFFDSARGSSALMAAVDAAVGLSRDPEETEGILYVMRRDGAARRMPIAFDGEDALTFSADPARPIGSRAAREDAIVAELERRATWTTLADLQAAVDASRNTVKVACDRLAHEGRLEHHTGKSGRHEYRVPDVSGVERVGSGVPETLDTDW